MTFIAQDYKEKELLIFNTAEEPLFITDALRDKHVRVVNQPTKSSGEPYTCLGDVRQAALEHMDGDIYVCWDDDDFFFPWYLSESVKKYVACGKWAWKPTQAYMTMDNGINLKLAGNALEATILVDAAIIKKFGYSTNKSGAEHTDGGWMDQCRDHDQLHIEDVYPLESYCYCWGSPDAPHKTSGHIDDPNNFENHKSGSLDFGAKRPLDMIQPDFMNSMFDGVLHMDREGLAPPVALVEKLIEIGHLEAKDRIEGDVQRYLSTTLAKEEVENLLGADNVFWLNDGLL